MGEQPEYIVEFVETPQIDAPPFGARGLAEHGIIGIPAAFANAISNATKFEFDSLPISPQKPFGKFKQEVNMIPFNFDYYKPDSLEEAINLYRELDAQGKIQYIMVEALNLLVWLGSIMFVLKL